MYTHRGGGEREGGRKEGKKAELTNGVTILTKPNQLSHRCQRINELCSKEEGAEG